MDTRRPIGELSGTHGWVESPKAGSDHSNHATLKCRFRNITIAIGILNLALACRNYTLRMLRTGVLVRLFAVYLGTVEAHAQNATWLLNPTSGDFDTAANWSPNTTVPTGTAFFGTSNTTTITFSNVTTSGTSVGTLQFNAGAPAYSFNLSSNVFNILDLTGTGIVNNSSNSPTITNNNQALTEFDNTSTAGNATITMNNGAEMAFFNTSTAGNATITNNTRGETDFLDTSTAGNATITNNGGNAATLFFNTSTAGNATITNNNGGATVFRDTSTAGNATITTNNGGLTRFFTTSTGGQARFITNMGGTVDISFLSSGGMTAGSIEGAGTYALGSNPLTVGLNNLSTEVSGTITGTGGSLIKVGTGTLTLTGTNTYTGGTTISAGTLQIGNGGTTGSITGNVTDNGTFALDRSGSVTFDGVISGTGALVQMGSGTLTLTGANTYSGGTTISAGTLNVSADNNLGGASGGLAFDGGTLRWASSFSLSATRAITLEAGGAPSTPTASTPRSRRGSRAAAA